MRFALLLLLPVMLDAAYPAVDYFKRGKRLNWTCSTGQSMSVTTSTQSAAASTNGVTGMCSWVDEAAPGNNQFSEVLVKAINTSGGSIRSGVCVRADESANTAYCGALVGENSNLQRIRIIEITAGSEATLAESSTYANTVVLVDDRLRLTVSGTSLSLKVLSGKTGSTERVAEITATDASIASGRVGLYFRGTGWGFGSWHGGVLGDTEPARSWACETGRSGKECHVTTTALNTGTGAAASPLPFHWLIGAMPQHTASGTIYWLHPGTYVWDQDVLEGSSSTGLDTAFDFVLDNSTVRAYPGAPVILDLDTDCEANSSVTEKFIVTLSGTNGILRDVLITNSGVNCKVPCGANNQGPNGIYVSGTNSQFLNSTVKQVYQGLLMQNAGTAFGGRVRGVSVYNTGRIKGASAGGHSSYTDNDKAGYTKYIEETSLFRHMSKGTDRYAIHNFSQSGIGISPFEFRRVVMFGRPAYSGGILLSGGSGSPTGATPGIVVDRVKSFAEGGSGTFGIVGNSDKSALSGAVITNNYIVGRWNLGMLAGAPTVTGNTIAFPLSDVSNDRYKHTTWSGYSTITSAARAGNVVTLGIGTPLTGWFQSGDQVVITGTTCPTDSANGTFTTTSLSADGHTITYTDAGVNETCTVTGAVMQASAPRNDTLAEIVSGGTWNNNTYYRLAETTTPFQAITSPGADGTGNLAVPQYTLAQWKALGVDADSTVSTVCPAEGTSCPDAAATNSIFIDPFTDEPQKCRVAIYNWKGLSSGVNVDLSQCGFATGDYYEIHDEQNLNNYASAVATGTYAGGNVDFGAHLSLTTIESPGDNYDVADPDGHCGINPPVVGVESFLHTSSLFGVFLVRRLQSYGSTTISWRGSTSNKISYGILRANTNSITWDFGPTPAVSCAAGLCSASIPTVSGRMYYRIDDGIAQVKN